MMKQNPQAKAKPPKKVRPVVFAKGREYTDAKNDIWECHGTRREGTRALMLKKGETGSPVAMDVVVLRRTLRPLKKPRVAVA